MTMLTNPFENLKISKKKTNFFLAPHKPYDDEELKKKLTHAERDFYMTLCHLENRYGKGEDGWFWHTDKSFPNRDGKSLGFESFGFGLSTCKRVRKKLKDLGLIETKREPLKSGKLGGTMYRINRQFLIQTRDHSEPWLRTTMNQRSRPP